MQRITALLVLAIAPFLLMAACTHQHARPAFARELAESNKVALEDGTVLEPQDLQYTHEGTMVLTTDGRRDVLHPGQVRTLEMLASILKHECQIHDYPVALESIKQFLVAENIGLKDSVNWVNNRSGKSEAADIFMTR